MAKSTSHYLLIVSLIAFVLSIPNVNGLMDDSSFKLVNDVIDWPISMSMQYNDFDPSNGDGVGEEEEEGLEDVDGEFSRRSLLWRRRHFYISYGALSADRIPCPPRSGRSYYTHSCFTARGPVRPYERGCSMITRCRS